ncbi:MAG: tripartite tricarboxylate transporter substrate binding protein [Rubrivivax sp.]|nr:tripartite tricarboxylate transporter substrate binding protein [Rubrivivax sp.]
MNRRTHLTLAAALALVAMPGLAAAQAPARASAQGAYPSKPIRLVVPFAAGTAPDVLARLVAPALGESMAANVVVENVPGAGGTIGVDRVAKSAPDGYTLLLSGDAALVLTGGAYGVKPPYETLRDLAPIAQLVITPNVLVVANDVPARNVQELVALVRSQPGKFSYGSGGIGFSQHRAGELMNRMAGLDMVHVPNPGNPWPDVIAGRVQLMFGNITVALPLIKAGKVRALAVSSTTRAPAAPDLPTVSESGLPGFESLSWFGVLAPAGTPSAVLQGLEAELQKAMATPAIKERVATMGAMPGVMNAAGFARVIENETRRWAPKPGSAAAPGNPVAVMARKP